MRDKLIHAHFGIDTEIIWQTIQQDIPTLKKTAKQMLKDQEKASI